MIGACLGLLVGCHTTNYPGLFAYGPSDQAVTASVGSAFMHNRALATAPIHIETHQGTVFLKGYVKTIRQSDMAVDVATRVPGVRAVRNELIVRK